MENRSVWGVALGGGGSRAFVHLGVLARLEEEGVRPGFVSGSSMGAVLGALYAKDPSASRAIPKILDYFRKSSLFGRLVKQDKGDNLHKRPGYFGSMARKMATASVANIISFRRGLRSFNPVNAAIDQHFGKPGLRFEDLAIPFAANALNLSEGKMVECKRGPLAPALKAGVAVGLVFAPHEWDGGQYADAAPLCPVPVGMCRRLGAAKVLAVDICAPLDRPLDCHTGFDVVRRIMSMQSESLNEQEIAGADQVLKIDASDVFWADFSKIDMLFERGREVCGEVIRKIK